MASQSTTNQNFSRLNEIMSNELSFSNHIQLTTQE